MTQFQRFSLIGLSVAAAVFATWQLFATGEPKPHAPSPDRSIGAGPDLESGEAGNSTAPISGIRIHSDSESNSPTVDDQQPADATGDLQREFGEQVSTDMQRRLLEQLDIAIAKNPDGSFRSTSAETYYPPETLEIEHFVDLYCDGKEVVLLPGDVASIEAALAAMRRLEPTARDAKREFFRALARSVVDRVWDGPPEKSVREHGRTAAVESALEQVESLNERFGERNRDYFTSTLFNEHGTVTLVTFRSREPHLFAMTDRVIETYRTTHRTVRQILRRY